MKRIDRILKKQRKILKDSYTDLMSVYRSSYTKNEIGETKFMKSLIYENVPCHLSISSQKASDKLDVTKSVVNEYLIFTDKEIFLEDNDEVFIKRCDISYKGKSSRSYSYDTHNETTLKVEERT